MNANDLISEITSAISSSQEAAVQSSTQQLAVKTSTQLSTECSSNFFQDLSVEDYNKMFDTGDIDFLSKSNFSTLLPDKEFEERMSCLNDNKKFDFGLLDKLDFEDMFNNLMAKCDASPILPESPLVNETYNFEDKASSSSNNSPQGAELSCPVNALFHEDSEDYTDEFEKAYDTILGVKRPRVQYEHYSSTVPIRAQVSGPIKKVRYNNCHSPQVTSVNGGTISGKILPPPQKHNISVDETSPTLRVPLPKFATFRKPNNITEQDFYLANQEEDVEHTYEANKPGVILTDYTPRVYRNLRTLDKEKKSRPNQTIKREGMCPYCPIDFASNDLSSYFHDMNSSQYASHILSHHGIFTTGSHVKEPKIHRIGIEKKPGKDLEVECVQCPYTDCHVNIKIASKKSGCHKFAAYFRHVKNCHRDIKNQRRNS